MELECRNCLSRLHGRKKPTRGFERHRNDSKIFVAFQEKLAQLFAKQIHEKLVPCPEGCAVYKVYAPHSANSRGKKCWVAQGQV